MGASKHNQYIRKNQGKITRTWTENLWTWKTGMLSASRSNTLPRVVSITAGRVISINCRRGVLVGHRKADSLGYEGGGDEMTLRKRCRVSNQYSKRRQSNYLCRYMVSARFKGHRWPISVNVEEEREVGAAGPFALVRDQWCGAYVVRV